MLGLVAACADGPAPHQSTRCCFWREGCCGPRLQTCSMEPMQEWPTLDQSLQQQMDLTVDTLQGIVQQPRLLSPRLLARPPFRFLHDLISAIQQQTGFAPGLYTDEEMDARAVQGKEVKVAYLLKIMTVVSLVLREPCPADPYKVVAGLEPENTNIFLQMLGKASLVTDAADIVQAVLQLEQQGEEEAEQQLYDDIPLPAPKQHPPSSAASPAADTSLAGLAGRRSAGQQAGSSHRSDTHSDGQQSPSRGAAGRVSSLFARAQESQLFRAMFRRQEAGAAGAGRGSAAGSATPGTPSTPQSMSSEGGATPKSAASNCSTKSAKPPQRKTRHGKQAAAQPQRGEQGGRGVTRGDEASVSVPDGVEGGCLPGLQLSDQVRRITQSTSAGLAMLRRNSSVVHPAKEPVQ